MCVCVCVCVNCVCYSNGGRRVINTVAFTARHHVLYTVSVVTDVVDDVGLQNS